MSNVTDIRERLIPAGRRNRPGIAMRPKGVTFHNSGNRNPGAGPSMMSVYVRGNDAASRPASWHYHVGRDTPGGAILIYRNIPEGEVAWHAGDGNGPGNMTTIAIEICENVMVGGEIDPEVVEAAALLGADICRRHEWEPELAVAA